MRGRNKKADNLFSICFVRQMLDKEQPDSMATVQMTKADYAASDVYSTTSEAPPVSDRKCIHLMLMLSVMSAIDCVIM